MEYSTGFPPSSPERSGTPEIAHILIARIGTLVLCGVLGTLGCKGSNQNTPTDSPPPAVRSQPSEQTAADRADRRREERENERQLFRND